MGPGVFAKTNTRVPASKADGNPTAENLSSCTLRNLDKGHRAAKDPLKLSLPTAAAKLTQIGLFLCLSLLPGQL